MMDTAQKMQLVAHCLQILQEKISLTQQAMEGAQHAANAEGKSSVGDKYETTRAQMQAERDRYARQLAEIQKQLQLFRAIDFSKPTSKIASGHLVNTSIGQFLIAVSLGEVKLNHQKVMVISPISPIAQMLLNKKQGDRFSFRNQDIEILEIS